jgi:hypothetical protein
MLRKSIVDQHGLFDEQFFMYSEEVDLCLRIRKAGWEIHWLPEAEVAHLGGQSTIQVADAMFFELYRNKVKYFRKHYGNGIATLFKAWLYGIAASRWLIAGLMASVLAANATEMDSKSRQYRMLLAELHGF